MLQIGLYFLFKMGAAFSKIFVIILSDIHEVFALCFQVCGFLTYIFLEEKLVVVMCKIENFQM